jgi:hypothetical protein
MNTVTAASHANHTISRRHQRALGRLLLFWTVVATFACTRSIANESTTKCANEPATFDGIQPLTYATVVGPVGSHVVLDRRHPQLCNPPDSRVCSGDAFLVPGDTVAVANICGNFAHVQFISPKKVTVGWVMASALKGQAKQASESNFVFSDMQPYPTNLIPARIRLTKGAGVPVCEAYLQRINKSPFDVMHQPYCDRPEDDSVPGFTKLVRAPLQPSEVNKLYKRAYNFEFPPRPIENDGEEDLRAGRVDMTKYVGRGLLAWRYDPPVDIFNNGSSANIVMWRGMHYGGWVGTCGVDLKESGQGLRSSQMPLVFKPGSEEIDEQATKLLTAHPIQQYDSALHTGNLYSTATDFRPIARSIGIFKYRELYYLDGFFDIWGDAKNERRGRPALANTLAVFRHKDGVSSQICEYQLGGRDYPKP